MLIDSVNWVIIVLSGDSRLVFGLLEWGDGTAWLKKGRGACIW